LHSLKNLEGLRGLEHLQNLNNTFASQKSHAQERRMHMKCSSKVSHQNEKAMQRAMV
jgi:hypothetical protein